MRKIFFFLFIFILASSCSDDNNTQSEDTQQIDLFFEQESLIPNNTNDLYAVQIYIASMNSESFTPYAYGLFDNPNDIKLKLNEENVYKAECTIIINGKNTVFKTNAGYEAPFITNTNKAQNITNSFTISNTDYLSELSVSKTKLASKGKIYTIPNVDRYYGMSIAYNKLYSSSTSITIQMHRVVFGVKLKVDNLKEGRIFLHVAGASDTLFVYPNSKNEVEQIYTCSNFNSLVELDTMSLSVESEIGNKRQTVMNAKSFNTRNTLHQIGLSIDYPIDGEAGVDKLNEEIIGGYYK